MCSHIDLSRCRCRSWCRGLGPARPRGIKRCLSVTPEREGGEGEMRSDTIRCDPSHRTHRRRTLLKIITALDCRATSVASVVGAHTLTHTHIVVFLHLMPQLVLSFAAVLLAVDFTCVPSPSPSPTHSYSLSRCPFRTLSLRHLSFLLLDLGFVLCLVWLVAVSVSVSVSLSIALSGLYC